jgi:hypothetical protein
MSHITFKGEKMLVILNSVRRTRVKRIFGHLLAAAMLAGSMVQSAPLAQPKKPIQHPQPAAKPERHPKTRAAISALQAARVEIEHADTDFGGYKKDAIESVDNALKRLRLALQFDGK